MYAVTPLDKFALVYYTWFDLNGVILFAEFSCHLLHAWRLFCMILISVWWSIEPYISDHVYALFHFHAFINLMAAKEFKRLIFREIYFLICTFYKSRSLNGSSFKEFRFLKNIYIKKKDFTEHFKTNVVKIILLFPEILEFF